MTIDERKNINRDFLIRLTLDGKTKLIGAGMLNVYVDSLTEKRIIEKLLNPKTIKYTYWDRKSLKIVFLPK
jgi:hypothetical protein